MVVAVSAAREAEARVVTKGVARKVGAAIQAAEIRAAVRQAEAWAAALRAVGAAVGAGASPEDAGASMGAPEVVAGPEAKAGISLGAATG